MPRTQLIIDFNLLTGDCNVQFQTDDVIDLDTDDDDDDDDDTELEPGRKPNYLSNP